MRALVRVHAPPGSWFFLNDHAGVSFRPILDFVMSDPQAGKKKPSRLLAALDDPTSLFGGVSMATPTGTPNQAGQKRGSSSSGGSDSKKRAMGLGVRGGKLIMAPFANMTAGTSRELTRHGL